MVSTHDHAPNDIESLTPLVRRLVAHDYADIVAWHTHQVHGAGSGAQVFRIEGVARTAHGNTPWSFIMKTFDPRHGHFAAGTEEPASFLYWKREWLAYTSGALEHLPGQLRPPYCLGAGEQPSGPAWIVMEDMRQWDSRWQMEHFRDVAQRLGRFNGAYLGGLPYPTEPWLSFDWLRGWAGQSGPAIDLLPSVADHPLVRQIYRADDITLLLQLWDERERFFAALDALPHTLCHHDLFPLNAFISPESDDVVAIDWAYVGRGAVGEELAPLFAASLAFFAADPDQADVLETVVLDGYLAGLSAAGWQGNADAVRFGYLAAVGLRYSLGTLTTVLSMLLDERMHPVAEQVFGHPLAHIVRHFSGLASIFRRRVEAAWQMLGGFPAR